MPSAEPAPGYPTSGSSIVSKPFSISLSSKSKVNAVTLSNSALNKRKRPRSSLADDSGSDEDARRNHSPQIISSFDHTAGGAIGAGGLEPAKLPLVIQGQKNKNWREQSRRKQGKNLLPAEEQAARQGRVIDGINVTSSAQEVYGLSVPRRAVNSGDTQMLDAGQDLTSETRVKSVDEEALEALLEGKKKSDLVLPAIKNGDEVDDRYAGRSNEEDAFKTDIASRPESASIGDYAAVPIEEFGAALLRGMGWKEGDEVGKRKDQISKPRIVERRPALLGIGAKEVPDGLEEPGAWGKGAKKRNIYTKGLAPVLLKNSKTGETLTEEELKAKKERQQRDEEDWRERRDRNLRIDEDKKTERGHRDKDRSHHSSRHSSARRVRDKSEESSRSREERERGKRRHRREYEEREDYRSRKDRRNDGDDYEDTRSRKHTEVY